MSTTSAVAGIDAAAHQVTPQVSQYLTFVISGEVYGIGILVIKEIIEYTGVTEVPMMPAFLRGVINLRGAVVAVADLAARFGKTATPVTKRTCIVIVEIRTGDQRQDVGIMVDAVNAVLDIRSSEIEPAPRFGAAARIEVVQGMAKVEGRFVILLSVDKLLTVDEITQVADASAESA